VDVVLPLLAADLERYLRLQRPTFERWYADLDRTTIVTRPGDLAAVVAATRHLDGVDVVDERALVPELDLVRRLPGSSARGWYLQQIIKLAAVHEASTDFVLVVDGDVFATRPVTDADIVPHGRALRTKEPRERHPTWVENAGTALGLAPLDHIADQLPAARAPLLLATSEAVDFPWRERPDWVRYVGPQISDLPGATWRSPWGADARPLVLVGFSTTFQDHAGVLQRVLDGLSTLPVRVLLTTGDTIDPAELRPGANAVVVRQAPHVAVLREAALVGTHRGPGSLIRALAEGLPTLVIPHGRDQDDNARRVTERGAGLSLPLSAGTEEIVAATRRLLDEPGFAEGAQRLGRAVRAEADASPLVVELEAAARALQPA
jgi:hypothetical protein